MKQQERRIVIPCCKTFEFVQMSDIIRCEGLQNYTRVYLSNRDMLISINNIGMFKSSLSLSGFYCCHKSHLINEQFILRYHKEGYVEMKDGSSVPLSRRRKDEFINQVLKKYNMAPASTKLQPLIPNLSPIALKAKI